MFDTPPDEDINLVRSLTKDDFCADAVAKYYKAKIAKTASYDMPYPYSAEGIYTIEAIEMCIKGYIDTHFTDYEIESVITSMSWK